MPDTPADQPARAPNGAARHAPTVAIDQPQLWAAAARAGLDPVTSKAIAEHIGIPEATMSRVLNGKRPPPASVLSALTVAFPREYARIVRPVMPDGRISRYRGAKP